MRVAASLLAASLVALPLLAQAQSAGGSDAASLMAEVAALEQQIQSLLGSASSSASASASVSPANPSTPQNGSGVACPELPRTLSLGSSGPDVTGLQIFLAQEGAFSASATGYFGTITQAAVESWQAKEGVVSGGDPSTTGYGVVGPKTRAAIEEECGASGPGAASVAQGECLPAQPPVQECSSSWQPVLDQNGCTEYYTCSIALPVASSSAAASSSPATSAPSSTTVCPVVTKPSCTGTVEPFGTDANGCVTSYECVL